MTEAEKKIILFCVVVTTSVLFKAHTKRKYEAHVLTSLTFLSLCFQNVFYSLLHLSFQCLIL